MVRSAPSVTSVGRYSVFREIAAGGMATVHYGRLAGPAGFARTVAIKRLHPQFAKDQEFSTMLLDEARLAARIQHPNVVSTLDVVSDEGELFLVLEYVHGESLAKLRSAARRDGERVPVDVASAILCDMLHGLHAAHDATNERGEPLHIVHRDVSPQNVLVGADGISKVLDFGVAKAVGRAATTSDGRVKGKLAYMSPEQVRGERLDRRSDVFAAGIVLWELLTGARLFLGENQGQTTLNVLSQKVAPPRSLVADLPKAVDAVVMKALARNPANRFSNARQMALALESAVPVASPRRVSEWVDGIAGDVLRARLRALQELEIESDAAHAVTAAISTPTAAPQGSQVSTISVSSRTPPRRKRWGATLGALGLIVLLAAGASVVLSSRERQRVSLEEDLPRPPARETVVATATTDVAAKPSESAPVTSLQSSAAVLRAPSSAAKPPKVATRPAKANAATKREPCRVKSYVDENGYTRFARECP